MTVDHEHHSIRDRVRPTSVGLCGLRQAYTGPLKRACLLLIVGTFIVGCSAPSAVNIALRKRLQDQQTEIDRLTRQHAADMASLTAATQPTTKPEINAAQAAALFTTHGVRLGRLTLADDTTLTVHAIPTDDDGNDLKAAGSIRVNVVPVKRPEPDGEWQFSAEQTRSMWNGTGLRYEYVVPCPWPHPPGPRMFVVNVSFTDALTGRTFETSQLINRE